MARYTHHDVYNVVATMEVTWHELVETAYAYGMSVKSQTKVKEVRDFLLAIIDSMDPQEAALYYPKDYELSISLVRRVAESEEEPAQASAPLIEPELWTLPPELSDHTLIGVYPLPSRPPETEFFVDNRPLVAKATGTDVDDWLYGGDNEELGFRISGRFLVIKIQEGYTIRIDGKKNLSTGDRTVLRGSYVVKVTGSPQA